MIRDIIASQQETGRKVGLILDRIAVNMPRGADRAALRLKWSQGHSPHVERRSLPRGITLSSWSSPADTVVTLPAPTESDLLALAWWSGAPDIARYEFLPAGTQGYRDVLHIEFGAGDRLYRFADGRPVINVVADERAHDLIPVALRDGYMSYAFCPVRGQDAYRTADPTLDDHGGRDGDLPSHILPAERGFRPSGADHGGHVVVWRYCSQTKKISMDAYRRMQAAGFPAVRPTPVRRRPATPRQIGYIYALLREQGDRETTVPSRLSLTDASDWIDRLLAERASSSEDER